MDKNRGAVGGWGIRGLRLSLSVGYPWVAPVGFTHGYVLVTALRFVLGCIKMCVRVLAGSTRNLILTLSNATRPRLYQLHGIWVLSLLIYEMDVSSGRDARLVRPHDG